MAKPLIINGLRMDAPMHQNEAGGSLKKAGKMAKGHVSLY